MPITLQNIHSEKLLVISIAMPTVTCTVAKGIPPRLRSPARPAKGKTKKLVLKRKAVESDADTSDSEKSSDAEPRSKKKKNKWRWEVSPESDVEIVNTDPEPEIEEIRIMAVPLLMTVK